ncbi:phage head-tail joining protein [Cereibacter sphaeroides]|uniref:phage head-tail joining protein n=1 Tax=Cereibacter sphaeroides TaxID=1063 RepID=UPI00399EFE19
MGREQTQGTDRGRQDHGPFHAAGFLRVHPAVQAADRRQPYASGTTRVSYDGKSVDYGSAEDLLARIRTIERAIAGTTRPLPVAGLAGFSRGDR